MSETQIAIKEKIHELRAKQRKFSLWEAQRASEVKHLIWMQSQLEDDIIILEHDLAKQKISEVL